MAAKKTGRKQRPNIVSVHLSPQGKEKLDKTCENRGMTIKSCLGRLIDWFVELDKTEQSVVMGHIEGGDVRDMLLKAAPKVAKARKVG